MTEPLTDRRKRSAPRSRDAGREATTEHPQLGTGHALPGLAVRKDPTFEGASVIRRDFDFVGKGMLYEPFNFDADVVEAINRSKNFRADILKAKQAINALTSQEIREAGLKELARIEEFVSTWETTKVPLTKRKEVVDQVAKTTERLAGIADDYAAKDALAAEATRRREKKAKKESDRKKKAELDQKNEEAARAKDAERNRLEAAQKEVEKHASNRSTLNDRGVLGSAETVAKSEAHAETAEEEEALRAVHATAQKYGTSRGKQDAAKALTDGLADLDRRRTESTNRSLGVLANFTTTAVARRLDAADLAWVIETAGVDPRRARCLAEVINVSGTDRSVARSLAGLEGREFTATAQHCVAMFAKGVPASSVLAAAQAMYKSPDAEKYLTAAGAKLIPGYVALADIAAPKELKEAVAYDLQKPGTPYTTEVARRLLVGVASKTPKTQAIHWLTERSAAPEFADLVDLFIDPTVDIENLRSVFKAAAKVYDAAETLGLCQRHRAALAELAAVVANGQPGCPDYADRVMANRARPRYQEVHQLAALRAVALLEAKSAKVTVTIGKQPVDFGRGPDNQYRQKNEEMDAKTGFVQLAFTDLAGYFEIHTHWGQNEDGRIYSMHVEYANTNGIEIHTDQVFRPLIDKVVELHNANYPEPDGGEFYA